MRFKCSPGGEGSGMEAADRTDSACRLNVFPNVPMQTNEVRVPGSVINVTVAFGQSRPIRDMHPGGTII